MADVEEVRAELRRLGVVRVGGRGLLVLARRNRGVVALAGREGLVGRLDIGGQLEGDLVELGLRVAEHVAGPVVVTHEHDLTRVGRTGGLELERAVADDGTLVAPPGRVADPSDVLIRDRRERREGHDRREVGERALEGDLEGHRIVVGDDRVEGVDLAVEEVGATLDVGHQVAVRGGELLAAGALPALLEVVGQDGLAVAELLVVLDLEGEDRGVVVGLEALGDERLELRVAGVGEVEVGETVEERTGDLGLVECLHGAGIEAGVVTGAGELRVVDELAALGRILVLQRAAAVRTRRKSRAGGGVAARRLTVARILRIAAACGDEGERESECGDSPPGVRRSQAFSHVVVLRMDEYRLFVTRNLHPVP